MLVICLRSNATEVQFCFVLAELGIAQLSVLRDVANKGEGMSDLHLVEHVLSQRAGLIMPKEVERLSVSSSHTPPKKEKKKKSNI